MRRTRPFHLLVTATTAVLFACHDAPSPADVTDASFDAVAPDVLTVSDASLPDAPAPDVATTDTNTVLTDASAPDANGVPAHVTLTSGELIGRTISSVNSFLAIPYAAPPVGDLRWRAPRPVAPWSTPRDATRTGAACMQTVGGFMSWTGAVSEDCLTVNVWAPAGASVVPNRVMVFVHGGGYASGSGAEPTFDGTKLAQHGVVVVTFNYRLGAFGFLAHTGLVAEDTVHHSAGNYGMLDQIAALQWVHDNIAQFNGDPAHVTLFGESAGAISVCALETSPLAAGLFDQIMLESGACAFLKNPLVAPVASGDAGVTDAAVNGDASDAGPVVLVHEPAVALGARFAAAIHCDTAADPIACMRAKSASEVFGTHVATPAEVTVSDARFQPAIDGYVLPRDPWLAIRDGEVHPVAFVGGTNTDEGTAFSLLESVSTVEDFRRLLNTLVPSHADEVLAMYPTGSAAFPLAKDAFAAFVTDVAFTCPTRTIARRLRAHAPSLPTYLYRFTRVNYGGRLLGLGVYHTAELPYVFGNFTGTFRLEMADVPVVSAMQGYWLRFAQTGDPNGQSSVAWPAFTTDGDSYLEIGDTVQSGTGLRADRCAVLDPWIDAL